MTSTITRQVLITVDKLLSSEEDWCQGSAFNGDQMCLFFGAISRARRKLGLDMELITPSTREYAVLSRLVPAGYSLPQHFNDDPKTTFRDIKALIARAIREA